MEGEKRREVNYTASALCDGGWFVGEHVGADVAAEGENCCEVYLDDLFHQYESKSLHKKGKESSLH